MPTKFFTNSHNYAAQIEGLTPSELSALLSGQEPERDEIVSLESGRVVRADGAIHFDLLLASDKGRLSTVRKLVAATPDAGVYRHRVGQGRRWVRELARALDH